MPGRAQRPMTLQELIRVVGEFSRDEHETGVVIADMVNRGLVKLGGRYQRRRVVIRPPRGRLRSQENPGLS
jgi:hypothetical protein